MKRAIIIHCWGGYPKYCWYPSVKEKLESRGFEVEVPVMPETEHPRLEPWLAKLTEVAGQPDEDLFLIGHSVGCITIMRYLESLPEDQKVGGVVLVAGFADDLGEMDSVEEKDVLPDFFQTPINFEQIKQRASQFVAIHSDNDPFVPMKHAEVFKEKLDAEIVVKQDMNHFSGEVDDEESCIDLPDVVEAIEKLNS